jgi:hypothetical protein
MIILLAHRNEKARDRAAGYTLRSGPLYDCKGVLELCDSLFLSDWEGRISVY